MSRAWRQIIKRCIPAAVRSRLSRTTPRPVRWGSLRRVEPVSRVFGLDRGLCVDRYYIERFLTRHAADIRGRVLEIGESAYTRRFGGANVQRADVLHAVDGNPQATMVGDLATGRGIPRDAFECIILTQTLPFIYDIQSAVAHTWSALKAGGVTLATLPGISQVSRYDMDRWGDYWRFTDASARRLFGSAFGDANVSVETHGNVLAGCALLQGLAAEELTERELERRDPDYQVLIAVRAVRP